MEVMNQSYECLSIEETLQLSEVMINQITEALLIPWTYARLILENHGWDSDEVNASANELGKKILLADCGIPFKKQNRNSFSLPSSATNLLKNSIVNHDSDYESEPECPIEKCLGCTKNVLEVEMIKLECEHLFCVGCWKSHIQSKFFHDKSVTLQSFFPIRCPVSKCGFILDEKKIEIILSSVEMLSFKMRLLERFIMTNLLLRLCPNRCCVIQTFEKKRKEKLEKECCSVTCKCQITFCFGCINKPNSKCSVRVLTLQGDSNTTPVEEKDLKKLVSNENQSFYIKNKLQKQLSIEHFQTLSLPIKRRSITNDNETLRKNQKEKKILVPFFELIDQQSDKVCYGVEDTVFAIESSAAKTVFCCKNYNVKNSCSIK